jgi:hypothetical protein
MRGKVKRPRLHAYVDKELLERLKRYCIGTNSQQSRVVSLALLRMLNGEAEGMPEKKLEAMRDELLRGMQGQWLTMEYELGDLKQQLLVLTEALRVLMWKWCERTSKDKHGEPSAALSSAQRRYQEATMMIRAGLVKGHRLVDELQLPEDWSPQRSQKRSPSGA